MNSNHIKAIGLTTAFAGIAYALAVLYITPRQPDEQKQNHGIAKSQQEMTVRMKHLENDVANLVRTIDSLTARINTLANKDSDSSQLLEAYSQNSAVRPHEETLKPEQAMEDSAVQAELLANDAPFWAEKVDERRTQNLESEILGIFQAQGIDSATLGVVDCRSSGCLLEVNTSEESETDFDPSLSIMAMSQLPERFSVSPPMTIGDEQVSKIFLEF